MKHEASNPERCSNCLGSVRPICDGIFRFTVSRETTVANTLANLAIITGDPEEALSISARFVEASQRVTVDRLRHWHCGLTEEEIRRKINESKLSVSS